MSLERFARSKRLTRSSEYEEVFERNEYRITSGPLLLLARGNNLQGPRIGFVVGKRAVPTAVHRNRIKRILRESFRLNQQSMQGVDIVILARAGVVTLDNKKLMNLAGVLWTKLQESFKKSELSNVVQGT
jgi:ribonuclease P protein component